MAIAIGGCRSGDELDMAFTLGRPKRLDLRVENPAKHRTPTPAETVGDRLFPKDVRSLAGAPQAVKVARFPEICFLRIDFLDSQQWSLIE